MSNQNYMNELFSAKLDTEEGRTKLSALGGDYVRDRLREESFIRKILPVKTVTKADLQVSVNHDTPVALVEVEPESRAMSMTFRDNPSAKYIRAGRFEVAFFTIGSERYEKTEEELLVYTIPITAMIQKQVVKDIQEIEDYTGLIHIEASCQSLQKEAVGIAFSANFTNSTAFTAYNVNAGLASVGKVKGSECLVQSTAGNAGAGVAEVVSYPCAKEDFTKLYKLFPGDGSGSGRLRCDQFLITDTDAEDFNSWTLQELGDKLVGESTVDGWKHNTVVGRKFVRTLKTDILRPGNIYAFASPEFLGKFMVLNKTKFYVEKKRNKISWEAWETIGMYLGNTASTRKLELFGGSVDAGITGNDAVLARFTPVDEKDLGKKNNRVDEGQFFPQIVSI